MHVYIGHSSLQRTKNDKAVETYDIAIRNYPGALAFTDTATTEIYTLSLHDALPIFEHRAGHRLEEPAVVRDEDHARVERRSEEHTSELQSRFDLVCRLLLEKKKQNTLGLIADAIKAINTRSDDQTKATGKRMAEQKL